MKPSPMTFESRCPVSRQETIRLARIMEAGDGAGIYAPLRFEAEIFWVRRASARAVLRSTADGTIVHEGPLRSDFDGLFTCVLEPMQEALAMVSDYELGPSTRLEAAVVVTLTDTPCCPAQSRWSEDLGIRAWWECPADWFLDDDALLQEWAQAPQGSRYQVLRRARRLRRDPDVYDAWTSVRGFADRDDPMGELVTAAVQGIAAESAAAAKRALREAYAATL